MDEISEPLSGPFNSEVSFSPGDKFFRHIDKGQIGKNGLPSANQFNPNPPNGSKGLSLNWSKFSSPESTLIQVGLTFKFEKQEFKDPTQFTVFSATYEFLKEEIIEPFEIYHTPKFSVKPPPFGNPNNRSHCDLMGEAEEIRAKLRNVFAGGLESVDMEIVKEKVEAIKQEWKKLLDNL
jgi:hypothetical protein